MSELSVKVNFAVIESNDPKYLLIGDYSQWGVAKNLPAYIRILPPGSETWITNGFIKENFNIFHTINLGLGCVTDGCGGQEYPDLDDGIWEICLESSFESLNKKRYYLKTDALRQKINKLYIKAGIDYNPDSTIVKDLQKIEFILSAANAYIQEGDHVKAKSAFDNASKITERQSNCRDCY